MTFSLLQLKLGWCEKQEDLQYRWVRKCKTNWNEMWQIIEDTFLWKNYLQIDSCRSEWLFWHLIRHVFIETWVPNATATPSVISFFLMLGYAYLTNRPQMVKLWFSLKTKLCHLLFKFFLNKCYYVFTMQWESSFIDCWLWKKGEKSRHSLQNLHNRD